jgi:hypothetical protein
MGALSRIFGLFSGHFLPNFGIFSCFLSFCDIAGQAMLYLRASLERLVLLKRSIVDPRV